MKKKSLKNISHGELFLNNKMKRRDVILYHKEENE